MNEVCENKKSFLKSFLKCLRTKREISNLLNVNDRGAREEIGLLASSEAIISGSFQTGYRIAKEIENLDFVEATKELVLITKTIKELNSRIDKLVLRTIPLIKYKKQIEEYLNQKIKDIGNKEYEKNKKSTL